eukprot:7547599-Prorocentrum_lima.AAC.1
MVRTWAASPGVADDAPGVRVVVCMAGVECCVGVPFSQRVGGLRYVLWPCVVWALRRREFRVMCGVVVGCALGW